MKNSTIRTSNVSSLHDDGTLALCTFHARAFRPRWIGDALLYQSESDSHAYNSMGRIASTGEFSSLFEKDNAWDVVSHNQQHKTSLTWELSVHCSKKATLKAYHTITSAKQGIKSILFGRWCLPNSTCKESEARPFKLHRIREMKHGNWSKHFTGTGLSISMGELMGTEIDMMVSNASVDQRFCPKE
jgi:hypothetical protein